jgi:hypothetical protein
MMAGVLLLPLLSAARCTPPTVDKYGQKLTPGCAITEYRRVTRANDDQGNPILYATVHAACGPKSNIATFEIRVSIERMQSDGSIHAIGAPVDRDVIPNAAGYLVPVVVRCQTGFFRVWAIARATGMPGTIAVGKSNGVIKGIGKHEVTVTHIASCD